MRVIYFTHSLLSDWNHGNAHFLRGVVGELVARGHQVEVLEPSDAWSLRNLRADAGEAAIADAMRVYPAVTPTRYDLDTFDEAAVQAAVEGVDLVIVHEWNDHQLVKTLGDVRRRHRQAGLAGSFRLLFHDTHHRAVTDPDSMAAYDLSGYDGVLAFGDVLRRIYLERAWTERAWTWHEAADTRVFHPAARPVPWRERQDLVWIGNWGDGERTNELTEFLLRPSQTLGLSTTVHGVRYPPAAVRALFDAGIHYAGYLPNHRAPAVYAAHRVTVHVPRRPYVRALPGIPTIRVFEALACGIPLVSAPWDDVENLFTPGRDFLVAHSGEEMARLLRSLTHDAGAAQELAEHGRRTLLARHTCTHRVDELLTIAGELGIACESAAPPLASPAASLSTGAPS